MHMGKCWRASSSTISARIPSPAFSLVLHSEPIPAIKLCDRLARIGSSRVSSSIRGSALAVICCPFSSAPIYCRVCGTGVRCGTAYIRDLKIREPVNLRPHIPKNVRELVMERDNYMCRICGATTNLQIDHIIADLHGGSIEPENLQVLCRACNASKNSGSDIDDSRKAVLFIRDKARKGLFHNKILTMKEISRVTGLPYAKVSQYQFQINKELKVLGLRLRGYPE